MCNCGGPRRATIQPAVRDRRTFEAPRPTRERRVGTMPGEVGYYSGPKGQSKPEKSG